MLKDEVIQVQRPEERELDEKRREQAALEANLADRELQLASLRAELSSFERKYLAEVGLRYAELDELKARAAERAAAVHPADERLQAAAREARAHAEETRSVAGPENSNPQKMFSPTQELKRLYREVAKRIHPDLTGDRTERARRQELMAEANRAYENGDESALARVFAANECAPETVEGEGAGAELVRSIRRISQIRGRLAEIEAEAEQLLRSDAAQLRMRCDEAARQGRDLFAELAERVEDQVARIRSSEGEETKDETRP